jgi:hypothetical protein
VDKRKNFPKEDQEKKQLEEIAHLYFSTPTPPSKGTKKPETRDRHFEVFSPFPRTLVVLCMADHPQRGLSRWFLFNLAVMLKILNGPVLVIGSEGVYEERYRFGFRPDRERLKIDDGPRIPSGNFGPMGVCLLDGRILCRGLGDEAGVYPVGPMASSMISFRYILSDEVQRSGPLGSLPGLVVLLVTPTTKTTVLLDRMRGADPDLFEGPGHMGIVVANAGSAEESDAIYLYWRRKLEERYDGQLAVEHFGALPSGPFIHSRNPRFSSAHPMFGPSATRGAPPERVEGEQGPWGVGILEDPDGPLTRFCRTTASFVQKKRAELLHSTA